MEHAWGHEVAKTTMPQENKTTEVKRKKQNRTKYLGLSQKASSEVLEPKWIYTSIYTDIHINIGNQCRHPFWLKYHFRQHILPLTILGWGEV